MCLESFPPLFPVHGALYDGSVIPAAYSCSPLLFRRAMRSLFLVGTLFPSSTLCMQSQIAGAASNWPVILVGFLLCTNTDTGWSGAGVAECVMEHDSVGYKLALSPVVIEVQWER